MFESDDWTFEDTFDDIDDIEKVIQSRPLCQKEEEESSSVKRRKVDNHKFSSLNNTFESELKAVANTVNDSSPANSNNNTVSRGNLLLEIFQKNASDKEIADFTKETKKISSLSKEVPSLQSFVKKTKSVTSSSKESKEKNIKLKTELDKKVKLVRIFPGPAGLVPDTKNSNIPIASYLNSAIEMENKTQIKRIETSLSKSQDEKNLCDEKAWKLLLDDLPNDFFKEYGIFTMKSRANASHCESMKVKFVAGTIDYIDHSRDDPFIILKDSTGSIEGTIHRDVVLNYPGMLEPNVVILLYDVGLLKTVTYVMTNKYHILVSRTNLLAVYSNKGRIVSMSHMEDVLSDISTSELDKDQCTPILEHCTAIRLQQTNENCDNISSQTTSSTSILTNDKSTLDSNAKCVKQITEKNIENCKIATESIFEDLNHSIDMDDLDINDDFFAVDCEFSSAVQNCPDHSSSKTIPRIGEIQRCESPVQRMKHLENMKKKSTIHYENKNKMPNSLKILHENVVDVTTIGTHHRLCENLSSQDNHAHETPRYSNLNVKSASPKINENIKENTKNLLSHFTSNNKYDSDDEFLSQLDIDNISNNAEAKY